jgi:adenine-specific DNA-methyltransferase
LNLAEQELLKPFYTTAELVRYFGQPKNKLWIIYTDSSFKKRRKIAPYPNIKEHLDKFRKVITSHNRPYGLHRARDERFFIGEKIVSRRKGDQPCFTYTDFPCYVSQTHNVIKTERINTLYLTALFNSRLVRFWLRYRGKMQGSHFQVDKEPILAIPIFAPSTAEQNRIAELVKRVIGCFEQTTKARSSAEQEKWSRLSSELDAEIQSRVELLYELTDSERAMISSEAEISNLDDKEGTQGHLF